jgi:hypothetical protein
MPMVFESVDIAWVGGSIYHGKGVRYTMSRRFGMP